MLLSRDLLLTNLTSFFEVYTKLQKFSVQCKTGSTVLCLPVLCCIERMFKIMYTALYSLQLCVILYRHVLEISMLECYCGLQILYLIVYRLFFQTLRIRYCGECFQNYLILPILLLVHPNHHHHSLYRIFVLYYMI